ncbi:Crp/Fnr family transcriptional regulator [Flavobacteriaceae bacterium MHTCC 0001]
MQNPKDYLRSIGHIPKETFDKLKSISKYKKFDANTQLTERNKVPSKIYLLISGVMRSYITAESGKEFNKNLFFSMSFAGPLTALAKNAPSKVIYATLTPCEVYEIDYQELIKLCETDIKVTLFYSKVLERVYMLYEKRQIELISLDASKRYIKLKEDIPNIDELVTQYHIASYLSITPVQLSRIRKKIKTTKV